jgi:hypothetical protein
MSAMAHRSSILARTPPGGLTPDAVHVAWRPQPVGLSPAAQERMRTQWEKCLDEAASEGRSLFDGSIARLIDVRLGNRAKPPGTASLTPSGSPSPPAVTDAWWKGDRMPSPGHLQPPNSPDRPDVHLTLGPGSYQAFVVTRMRDRAWFEDHAPESLTFALGNSVLMTHGNEVLLGIRSKNVSAYAGRIHQFGGVLETLDTPKFPASVEGLIAHLLMELREELALDPRDLAARYPLPHLAPQWPRLLGVFYDHELGQPEAIFARRIDKAEHDSHVIVTRHQIPASIQERLTPLAGEAVAAWSRAT